MIPKCFETASVAIGIAQDTANACVRDLVDGGWKSIDAMDADEWNRVADRVLAAQLAMREAIELCRRKTR